MKGNFGRVLDVNLSEHKVSDYPIPEEYYRKYIGGKGLGARLLWDLLPKEGNTNPFGEENVMVLMVGPLSGRPVMGSSRYVAMTKSPLSKFVTESYGGGFFPHTLKQTGYDGIIIRGISAKPVYLAMIDGKTELQDASGLWGKTVFEAHHALEEKHGEKVRTALIGPAGERKVRFAAIINDMNRAAARGGPGAVLGSKLFKGIVVRGNQKAELADEVRFNELAKTYRKKLMDKQPDGLDYRNTFGVYGTSGGIPSLHKMNILPTKNFKYAQFEHFDKISGQYMEESGLLVGRETCATCGTFCKRKIEGEHLGITLTHEGSSLEYENLASFGSMILNKEIKLAGVASQLCNEYGLDTISCGNSIAFVMEATEMGMAGPLGIELEWGNEEQVLEAIRKIAYREDWGNELAEGTWRMSMKIGGEAFAMHAKGMEFGYHEPRGKVGLGLSYATSPRGGTHMEGMHDTGIARENAAPKLGITKFMERTDHVDKAAVTAIFEDTTSFTNSLIVCAFDVVKSGEKFYNLDDLSQLLEAATGFAIGHNTMLEIGARTYNIWRMVAVREGLTAEDDDLPDRFKLEPLVYADKDGNEIENAITQDKLDYMLRDYYQSRGWDETGKPNDETIKSLGLPRFT
ncbi:MAG: aldehyde ferredoxin oxidoreductase family protein [Candidatus Heimdallarchaeota archaeon]|nr:aldehyde ferredoxin oxidoreductase family protein [Candidatus Heimdallarchaeota archaeon]